MVKKKSFWLTLLAVLTAAVLVFCACGLVGCSSEENPDGSVPDEGEDDGSFTLQGYYDAYGTDYWGVIDFYADGTGYFTTLNPDGSEFSMFCGDIEWEYDDSSEMTLTAYMEIMTQTAEFPVSLSKVNGAIVAGEVYISEVDATSIFYESGVAGALESKYDVGSGHAFLVLNTDKSCEVVISGETEEGTWSLSSDNATLTVTAGSATYTATATVNDKDQIRQAVFGSFSGVDNLTFLPMGDEALLDFTLYNFISEEGSIVIYETGDFEATIGTTTYTGDWDISNGTLTLAGVDADGEDYSYDGTLTYESDNVTIAGVTFEEFFGDLTNVEFIYGTELPKTTFEIYSDYGEHGEAIAILYGKAVTLTDGEYVDKNDGVEYWTFLYRDGEMIANAYDGASNITNGNWTWGSETENGDLVPVLNRNYNTPYYAYANDDGTWSVLVANGSSQYTGTYYLYTFDIGGFPAGAFSGTKDDGSDGVTYYVVLNYDGTFKAHIGGTGSTSTGYWAKDESGTFTIGKSSADYSNYPNITYTFVECSQTSNNDGTVTVAITNYGNANTFYYIIDTSIIPVGGYDLSEFGTQSSD